MAHASKDFDKSISPPTDEHAPGNHSEPQGATMPPDTERETRPIRGLRSPIEVMVHAYEVAALPLVPTGFPILDGVLGGGLRAGDSYYLAAPTGQGKTSLVLQVARKHVANGGSAIIWTMEMPDYKLQARLIAQMAQVDWLKILGGEMDEEAYKSRATELEAGLRYYEGRNMDGFQRAAQDFAKQSGKPPLVIVDYLQKLPNPGAPIREGVTRASEALRKLASELKAPVVIVSAVSRSAARRIRDPRSADPEALEDVAKESGSVEYDSGGLFVLRLNPKGADGKQTAVMTVAKNRYGDHGQVELSFDGETGRFAELGYLEPKARRDQRERREEILEAVSEADGPPSKNTIHSCVGGNKRAVLREIDAMVRDGELAQVKGGFALGEADGRHEGHDGGEAKPEPNP